MSTVFPIIQGMLSALLVSIISLILCIVPGTLLCIGRLSKISIIKIICTIILEFFDGVPVLVQLLFVYYGLPLIFPDLATISSFVIGIIVLSINGATNVYTYYLVYKNNDVKDRTIDSLKTLSITLIRVFAEIIKNTSLLSIIGFTEILRKSNMLMMAQNKASYLVVGIIVFLTLNIICKSLIHLLKYLYKNKGNGFI